MGQLTEFTPGQVVGHLTIARVIGRGAFGCVYEAQDRLIGRRVALKVVSGGTDEQPHEIVLREARAVGRLSSPQIVTLFRVEPPGVLDAWLFEMELVEGGSLASWVAEQRTLPLDRVAAIAADLAMALDTAHEMKVVHGDVKPGNVLLTAEGRAKLADFGLSRFVGDSSVSLSLAGSLRGTPIYMAPEVIMGEPATPASDVWSYGVVLYQLLTGRTPFAGTNAHTLFYAIQASAPAPPAESLPPAFRELLMRCLAKDARQRPATCGPVAASLAAGNRTDVRVPAKLPRAPIGRTAEFGSLIRVVEEGGFALLTGETGIGKTELVHAVRDAAQARGMRWIEARVTPLEGLVQPLLEAVREAAALRRDAGSPRSVYESANDLVQQLLAGQGGLRLENRSQAVWALEQVLGGLASSQRLALLIEDLQDADSDAADIVKHLARYLAAAGIAMLVTCRSDTDAGKRIANDLGADGQARHVRLGRLSREDTFRFLEQHAPLPADAASRIFELTQGNPLYALEMHRHLNATEKGTAAAAAALPRRFHDVVELRLAKLGEADRMLIDVAATDGMQFDGEAVAAVMELPLLAVLRSLQRLYREHGIVEPSPRGFRFSNAIFHEVLYAKPGSELRRQTHLALARHLEGRPEPADPERIATHWERGGESARARPHLLDAALAAARRQELRRTVAICERAGLFGTVPAELLTERSELLFILGGILGDLGERDRCHQVFQSMIRAAEQSGEETMRLRALVRHSEYLYWNEGVGAVDWELMRRVSTSLPSCAERGLARYLLGVAAKYGGNLDEARRWFESAGEVFRELQIEARRSSTIDQLASVALRSGRPEEAEELYEQAACISDACGRRANAATSRVNRVLAAMTAGRLEGLDAELEQCIRVLLLEGAENLATQAEVELARIHYSLGQSDRALAALERARTKLEQRRYLPGLIAAELDLAWLRTIRGEAGLARTHLETARELARKAGDAEAALIADGISATLAWCEGNASEGLRHSRAAVEAVARSEQPPSLELILALSEAAIARQDATDLAPLAEAMGKGAMQHSGVHALLAAVSALVGGASSAELAAAHSLLSQEQMGYARASVGIIRERLLAELRLREGSAGEAVAIALRARADAARLGDVWLEAECLRFLHRAAPAGGHAENLRRHLAPFGERAASAWLAPTSSSSSASS